MSELTADRLRELLDYDPETGLFTRKIVRTSRGTGWPDKMGYLYIMVDAKTHSVHRLAWLYMTGEWPMHEIDHIDGDKANNRFANLRDIPRSANMQNEVRARITSTSGYAGVSFRKDRGKWIATIRTGPRGKIKSRRLGSFDSAEEAHLAYLEAKRKEHPGFTG